MAPRRKKKALEMVCPKSSFKWTWPRVALTRADTQIGAHILNKSRKRGGGSGLFEKNDIILYLLRIFRLLLFASGPWTAPAFDLWCAALFVSSNCCVGWARAPLCNVLYVLCLCLNVVSNDTVGNPFLCISQRVFKRKKKWGDAYILIHKVPNRMKRIKLLNRTWRRRRY